MPKGGNIPFIAYFVSPHGYGHAARAAGVMEALSRAAPELKFHIFTTVPRWFFNDSLSGRFHYHNVVTDIGLVQKTPLQADLSETLARLGHFLPFDSRTVKGLSGRLSKAGCRMVLCDIAPLGIRVSRAAGIPSVLIENFTWDWLYEPYAKQNPAMAYYIRYLGELFRSADLHIRTQPACQKGAVDLTTSPVSRKIRIPSSEVRRWLNIPKGSKVVLITMGGIAGRIPFLRQLRSCGDIRFIVPGGWDSLRHHGNLVLLPHHSRFFHPDLMAAADAVVGKVGYSTLAEAYQAGVPFGYVARPGFRESRYLVSFVRSRMKGLAIREKEFRTGAWLALLPELLGLPRIPPPESNGADQIADFLLGLL